VFRRGGDVSFVVEELKAVFDPRGGQWMGGRYVPSLLAAIGDVIEKHMIAIGFLKKPGTMSEGAAKAEVAMMGGAPEGTGGSMSADMSADNGDAAIKARMRQCPKCAQASLIRQEGCDTCISCDYSKCG